MGWWGGTPEGGPSEKAPAWGGMRCVVGPGWARAALRLTAAPADPCPGSARGRPALARGWRLPGQEGDGACPGSRGALEGMETLLQAAHGVGLGGAWGTGPSAHGVGTLRPISCIMSSCWLLGRGDEGIEAPARGERAAGELRAGDELGARGGETSSRACAWSSLRSFFGNLLDKVSGAVK